VITDGGIRKPEVVATNQMITTNPISSEWVKSNLNATPVTFAGVNALGLKEYIVTTNSSNGSHLLADSAQSGSAGAFWAILKKGSLDHATIRRGNDAGTDYACFDLDAGTVTEEGSGITNAYIEDLGDGYYKCVVVTADTNAATAIAFSNSAAPGTGSPVFVAANDTMTVCHIQYEANLFDTSPIDTDGAVATRNAEDMVLTDWIPTAPYTVLIDQTAPIHYATENRILRLDTGPNILKTDAGGTLNLKADSFIDITEPGAIVIGDRDAIAIRYEENNAALVVGGGSPTLDTSCSVNANALGSITLGGAGSGGIIHKVESYV
jgi:hypothetical protein